jgi:transcriptional regulator
VERLAAQVLAFELPIERLEGKSKLSQNRSAADRKGVLAALRKGPAHAELLEEMDALYREDGTKREDPED